MKDRSICTNVLNHCHHLPTSILNTIHRLSVMIHNSSELLPNTQLNILFIHVEEVGGKNVALVKKRGKKIIKLVDGRAIDIGCTALLQCLGIASAKLYVML